MAVPLYIIYLDIDGVLNRANVFYPEQGAPSLHYEPRCVAELNRILEATGAEMVLSSAWRLEKDRDVSKLFRMWGISGPNPQRMFLGKTHRTDYRYVGAEARAAEIKHWQETWGSGATRYCAIDDLDLRPWLPCCFVKGDVGLTSENADAVIQYLLEGRKGE